MHFSPAQSFTHRQSMVVTAQLQQAIRLLQMGNAELQEFIETQAQENPFLDTRIPLAPLPDLPFRQGMRGGADDWDRLAALPDTRKPSLYAHVEAYVEALQLAPRQARIAGALLDLLEPSGWLGQPVATAAEMAGVSVAEALEVLTLLQRIEPAGLFARDLAECLRLQAVALNVLDPVLDAVLDHLPMVGAANMAGLARVCACAPEQLRPALRMLRSFDPKPGASFDSDPIPELPPDLIASRGVDGWKIDLNRSTLPGIVIRPAEAPMRQSARTTETSRYFAERLAVARWLARAVAHRNETALKIGAEILRRQTGFLDQGAAYLAPMTVDFHPELSRVGA